MIGEDPTMQQMDKILRVPATLTIAVLLMILAEGSVTAGGPAGILLYHRDGDNVLVLLANDSKGTRGWSGFGGGAEGDESLRATAARETEEETRGYFSRVWLEEQIADQQPLSSRGFHMFFVQVPFVPAQRVMNNPVEGHQAATEETQFYAWVPFSELEPVLAKDNPLEADLRMNPLYVPRGCGVHSFWRVWILNMHDAQKQGVFPWCPGTSETERATAADAKSRPSSAALARRAMMTGTDMKPTEACPNCGGVLREVRPSCRALVDGFQKLFLALSACLFPIDLETEVPRRMKCTKCGARFTEV